MTTGELGDDPEEADAARDLPIPPDAAWFAEWRDSLPPLDEDEDDDLDETAPFPLPPDDRLWRHPSELKFLDSLEHSESAVEQAPVVLIPVARMPWKSTTAIAIAAGLVGATIATVSFALLAPRTSTVIERVVEQRAVPQATFTGQSLSAGIDIPAIAESATPAIVRVEVLLGSQATSSGSGVIFRDDGHLITNAHVVDGAQQLRVILAGGESFEATLVGTDILTDIAVLQIVDADQRFPVAVLGSTEPLRVGELAIAIGSPLRLHGGPTVTVGVVSATHRRLQTPNGAWLYDLVQTDAPISPGSSGGALLDSGGAVIGITTAVAISEVGAEGLGFATPIEVARAVAGDLITYGEARHGQLGVRGEDAGIDDLFDGYENGVAIREVTPNGPAAAAGIEIDDIIVEIDGEQLASMTELVVKARLLEPGEPAVIRVIRDDLVLDLTLIAGQLN